MCWALTEGPDRSPRLLNHPLELVPWGKGRPGVPEATCPWWCVRWSLQPPSCQYPALSLVSCQCVLPWEGRGTLISDAVWGRAPRPLGALRSSPRGLEVISPARPEGNPTWEPGAQGLLLSALQHQVRSQPSLQPQLGLLDSGTQGVMRGLGSRPWVEMISRGASGAWVAGLSSKALGKEVQ